MFFLLYSSPTYTLFHTELRTKVSEKERIVEFEMILPYTKLRVCFGMEFAVLDAPFFWLYFVAKSSAGRSTRRYVP